MTVEEIYGASFALLQTLSSSVSPPGPFKTVSRRLRLVEEVGAQEMPAIYQHQLTVEPVVSVLAGFAVLEYRADWYIYVTVNDMNTPTTPVMNPLVQKILDLVPHETSGQMITVQAAGVTVNLTIDGPIQFFEGLLDVKSVARIPICIKGQQ